MSGNDSFYIGLSDQEVLERYGSGSTNYHDLTVATRMLSEMFYSQVRCHPSLDTDPEAKQLADIILDRMAELFTKISERDVL